MISSLKHLAKEKTTPVDMQTVHQLVITDVPKLLVLSCVYATAMCVAKGATVCHQAHLGTRKYALATPT
jgi:hypothetical protein